MNREKSVYWQYQTILFEFQKDGLLGDKYIDDEEVENLLNEQGRIGWELVNVTTVQEGLLAFLKKEIQVSVKQEKVIPSDAREVNQPEQQPYRQSSGQVQVRDNELIKRSEKKRSDSLAKGDSDQFGGIKIS